MPRARVEDLTEQEAQATLDFIASRGQSFGDWLDRPPSRDADPLARPDHRLAEQVIDPQA